MKMIQYVIGDATDPRGEGTKIIAHICNDVGAWGKGFVLALSRKWPKAERAYRNWASPTITLSGAEFKLGSTDIVRVMPDIYVANMIAQRGIRKKYAGQCLVDYQALESCLHVVARFIQNSVPEGASIHMPRIGVGLGGGTWSEVVKCIEATLQDFQVFVYDLPRI
jgi:O-acetyl-ADP-ribose deacetylase (regulator of RNase III)